MATHWCEVFSCMSLQCSYGEMSVSLLCTVCASGERIPGDSCFGARDEDPDEGVESALPRGHAGMCLRRLSFTRVYHVEISFIFVRCMLGVRACIGRQRR